MIRRATIEDYDRVKEIMIDDSTYPYGIDDGCPSPGEYTPTDILSDGRIYVLLPDNNSVALFVPINHINYDVHICALPESRGKNKLWFDSIEYMFTKTPCEKITARIPEGNQLAYAIAKKTGFVNEGISMKSIKINGALRDTILLGITKEEWKCLS